MSDPSFLTYQFSQQVPKTTLTDMTVPVVEFAQQREAERIRSISQLNYDKSLQNYMEDPTEERLVQLYGAAEPLGLTDQTRATVGEVQQIRAARAAEELRAEQEAVYNDAMRTFMSDMSPENLQAWLESGAPLGKFEQVLKQAEMLSQAELEQQVQDAISVLAYTRANNVDKGIETALGIAEGYRNSGSPDDLDEAKTWEEIANQLRSGKLDAVNTFLTMTTGILGEYGQNAIGNLLDLDEAKRQEFLTEADLLKVVDSLEFPSEEERSRVAELADGLPYGIGKALVEMASIVSLLDEGTEEMTVDDLLSSEEKLRKEYDTYVEPYEIVVDQFDVMFSLYNGFSNPSGMSDTALLTLYNKVLDPTSVVREAEAARTESAAGVLDRADAAIQGVSTGVKFNDETRAAIINAAIMVNDISQREIDKERDRLQRTINDILQPLSTRLGVGGTTAGRVFPDVPDVDTRRRNRQELIQGVASQYKDEAEVRVALETLTEDEIRESWPQGVALWEAGQAKGRLGADSKDEDTFTPPTGIYEEF